MNQKILLASGSPRRSFLLDQMDITFRVFSSDVEEVIPDGMGYADVPSYLAALKGRASLSERRSDEILLAADTVVIYKNAVLGKPRDAQDAYMILKKLSGDVHDVITGVYLNDGKSEKTFSDTTKVEMSELSDDEIDYYTKTYKPSDKAGAYGIQEWIGWAKIKAIHGSYSNIMGLPTHLVYEELRTLAK